MKCLLIKDFYTMKPQIKGMLISSFFCFAFVFVLKLSSEFGNLKDSWELNDISFFIKIIACMVGLLCIFVVSDLIDRDRKSGMSRTVRSAKITHRQLISSRYVMLFAAAVMGFILSAVFQVLCHITGIMDFELSTIGITILAQLFCMMISSVSIGAGLISGSKAVSDGAGMAMGLVSAAAITLVGFFYGKSENVDEKFIEGVLALIWEADKTAVSLIIAGVSVLIIFLSYLLSLKFGRDEY